LAYDAKAQEFAFGLYCRMSKERALEEMRKVYPGVSGSTWDDWVNKLDWRARRAESDARLREFDTVCRDTGRVLMVELQAVKDRLLKELELVPGDTQKVYAFTSVTKQMNDIAAKYLTSRDPRRIQTEVIADVVEKLLAGMRGMDGLGQAMQRNAVPIGQLVARLTQEFGAEQA
jgi:hypothetical protein